MLINTIFLEDSFLIKRQSRVITRRPDLSIIFLDTFLSTIVCFLVKFHHILPVTERQILFLKLIVFPFFDGYTFTEAGKEQFIPTLPLASF